MAGYHVENFGCRASHADGDAIAAALGARAAEAAAGPDDADVVVVNTCSVTAQAEQTARSFLRHVRRSNPSARVVVTGCYAQRAPQEVAAIAGVTTVIGNSHKAWVADAALGLLRPGAMRSPETSAPMFAPTCASFVSIEALGATVSTRSLPEVSEIHTDIQVDTLFAHADFATFDLIRSGDTRPNLKVQDGCDNRCSFCIIPTTRGHSRSLPLQSVLDHVRRFVDAGGHELVLSGINLGRWGRDLQPGLCFEHLVAAILEQTTLPRLRLSSVEPMDWSPRLLDLCRTYAVDDGARGPRLARHAHLPLQSGCDRTLRAMHRRYRPWHYQEKIEALSSAMSRAAIGADVMVGFPGETDAHFEESYRFIEGLPFTYLHLFPFSARPGTPGWELHRLAPVPAAAVKERFSRLRSLIAQKTRSFRAGFVGECLPVITLRSSPEDHSRGVTRAISDNFIPLEIEGTISSNRMLRAHIQTSKDGLLRGTASQGQARDPVIYSTCEGMPSHILEDPHSSR